MAEDQDNAQRTEEPTQKRIEDAVKRGQVAFSKEVTSFLMLLLMTVFVIWVSPNLLRSANIELSHFVLQPHNFEVDYEGDDVLRLAIKIILDVGYLLMIPLIIALVGAFLGSFIQNGFVYSPEAIHPNLSKISPLSGLKRIFSLKSIVELLKGILKITMVALVVYTVIKSDLDQVVHLHTYTFSGIILILSELVNKSLLSVCAVMGVIAVLDYFYQRMEHLKSLRMTKQEVKEELKQTEGNPEIKAKLRALRLERARKRMMAEVPKADVIITNPTHYSIALKYTADDMPAPKVVAKGIDKVALRIREIARENWVPIVENKLLARSLYEAVELDDFIHVEHYEAVAKIISKVMKIKKPKK
jgi:flagellar biosynthetic protein FlhB